MKLIRYFFTILVILLFTVQAYAAGSITGTATRVPVRQGSPPMVLITLTCTADATAHTWPATVVNTLDNVSTYDLRGLKLYSVMAIPSAVTAPTAATDLTITDTNGVDLLGGKGTDFISDTAKTWIPAGPSNYAFPALITGNITVTMSNNLVNSAVITLVLQFVGD